MELGLEIRRTDAKIGMERTPGRWELRTQPARLELQQNQAAIRIDKELPRLEISPREAFAAPQPGGTLDLNRRAAEAGYNRVMGFIAKCAQEGDRLAAIEMGGNPLADIAESNAFPEEDYSLPYIPRQLPGLQVRGYLQIDGGPSSRDPRHGVTTQFIPGSIDSHYQPAVLRMYTQQYPSIKIDFTGKNIDTYR